MKRYLFYISENYSFQILRPLQQEIIARGDSVKWFVEGTHVNRSYFKPDEQELVNADAVKKYNPIAVFVPGNFVPSFIPGLKVQVFHGFVGWKKNKRNNINYHFEIRECFDLYCTHGPSSTEPFNDLAVKHKTFSVAETGWSKLDPYFDASIEHHKKSNDKPVVLFSSTFTPRLTQAPALKETIYQLSKTGKFHWLVTFHPKMAPEIISQYKALQHDHLEFVETDDLIPYMEQADIMLGDYSSMMTDFLMLRKPVVTFNNPDFLTGLTNISSLDELEISLEQALEKPNEMMAIIDQYCQQTHPYEDGLSSARVLDAVDAQLKNPPKLQNKPLNLVRNFKHRKKLNYWKFW